MNKTTIYHFLAIIVVMVWGTTYISAKVLLREGLEAHEIYVLRFILAYLCMCFLSFKKWIADSWKDELKLMLLGLTGGTMYFVMQNLALEHTYGSTPTGNTQGVAHVLMSSASVCVSLWICKTPRTNP